MASELQKEVLKSSGATKGYLLKKKKGRLLTSWKRRWFVLQDGKLLYYVSDEETKLKGSVDVACLSVHRNADEEDVDRRCCFALVEWDLGWLDGVESTDVPNRAYLMSAETDDQVDLWFNAIARAKTQYRRAKRRQLENHRVLSAHDLLGLEGVSRMAEDYKLQLQQALPQAGKRLQHAPSRLSSVLMPSAEDACSEVNDRLDHNASRTVDLEEAFMRDFLGVTESDQSAVVLMAVHGDLTTVQGLEGGDHGIVANSSTSTQPAGANEALSELPTPTRGKVDPVTSTTATVVNEGSMDFTCEVDHAEPKVDAEAPPVAAILCGPPVKPAPPPPAISEVVALEIDTLAVPTAAEAGADPPLSPSSFKTASARTTNRRTRLLGQRNSFHQRSESPPPQSLESSKDSESVLQYAAPSPQGSTSESTGPDATATSEYAHEQSVPTTVNVPEVDTAPGPDEVSDQDGAPQKMNMLLMVAHEILSTEKAYLRDLSKLQRIYAKPLMAEHFLTKEQQTAIFSNTEELMDVSARLLGALRANVDLEGSTDDYRIGAAFVQELTGMSAFVSYCATQNSSLSTLASLCRTNPQFVRWMDTTDAEQPGQLGLNSFLVKPLQRLCKYPLLFRELLAHMPEDHLDRSDVTKADQGIAQLLFRANETKRTEDNRSTVVALDEELKWPGDSRTLASPERLLLRKDFARANVGSQKPAKMVIILMSDLLIAAKEKERRLVVKGVLQLRDAIVWEIKNPKLRHAFSVVQQDSSGSPKIVIMCKTEEEKESWIVDIMDAQTRLLNV